MSYKRRRDEDEDDTDSELGGDSLPAIRRHGDIPQFPVKIDSTAIEVDAPDNIQHNSTFDQVQENDVKILNLALTAQLHALGNTKTVDGVCKVTKSITETLRARRDALLMQKEKEPSLAGKGGIINLNPID